MSEETLEQMGARNLQALLVNPLDGLAMHNMIKYFTAAVKAEPETCTRISALLDQVGRSLCAAAMQSQALISAKNDRDKLRFGMSSVKRINRVYSGGYSGTEDVGYWKHNILHPEKQLNLLLDSYIRLLRENPLAVKEYSQSLMNELRDLWRPQHLDKLRSIYETLKQGGADTQGKANLLMAEVVELKRSLTNVA